MDILYTDKRILAAIKPAGVLSTDEAGGMPSLLRAALGDEKACVRTVHRLDAAVSGVMVFARSAKAASLLSEQIRNRQFQKEYLAVVHGAPPAEGTLCDLLGRDTVRRITYVADAPGKDVREAKLSYRVLGCCEGYSLVSICLHTGRTHQIRVQFASRGWPLAGDRKYGVEDGFDTIALWSHRITFTHPETGEAMGFTALPPKEGAWEMFAL
ncbi:MAG: RluA family pseudouridine synthase [Ruminococcaceae bacterium]|nr:RluA family pseudouridine synthase [Oscillospiraceae bacterium]